MKRGSDSQTPKQQKTRTALAYHHVTLLNLYMSNSQKVAIFFIPVLIDDLQIYVIDVYI